MTAPGETPPVPAASTGAADGDSAALDRIAELLRAERAGECGPYLPGAIDEIVRGAGRDTGDPGSPV